jgi:uncharacterized protein YhbP (UPF0306 family)
MIRKPDILSRKAVHLSDRQRRIHNFLKERRIGVLSMVTPDNDPHGVVVYYVVDDDFRIHILTKKGTRKYDDLTHNSRVMLTVFEPHSQTTAQLTGVAVERSGSNDINEVAGAIMGASLQTSDSALPPIVKLQAGAFTTFQIEPLQIRMAIYARPDPGDYEKIFESVESFDLRENG